MNRIRVVLADDQTIVREGLRALLETDPSIHVVAEAENGEQACELVEQHQPTIVLMDVRMPGLNGVEATKRIKQTFPSTVILILTTFDDDAYILNALANGAAGYLLKDINAEKLIGAIHDAVNGSLILPSAIAAKISSHVVNPKPPEIRMEAYTPRERDIIALLLEGRSNQEIAQSLYLTVGTVKNYLSQLYGKAGISDRAKQCSTSKAAHPTRRSRKS
jgi:DNA-binding NarL/FixJ family response regulator